MEVFDTVKQEGSFSTASGANGLHYVVLQVTLKEKFFGTGSGNLTELEDVINKQASKGYRLHTITTANGGSKGLGGGDRIQATMVFEKII
ncbi:DUF4177 domain-containing protein [Streptococcus sp. KHUD_018]|jgi:hypothetical protein|nr:DUF4177 domain-containing protein [Streptococcus mitis]DAT48420.1 MAG TPA: protein of unknown function (DUF4177) [Caudoviricetes sp.]DAT95435.1 MAG TPA: protein of unknown function (DUF4177) [Caudoviricetes sp.]